MTARAVVLTLVATAALAVAPASVAAEAESPPARSIDELVDQARGDHAAGRHAEALDALAEAYALEPRPSLLFAMGQMEFNLGHYDRAVARYEQFLATKPEAADVDLAIQAIAVARDRIDAPPPPPPPPPETIVRVVSPPADRLAWTLAIAGGASGIAGGALYLVARQQTSNTSGRYADYVDRLDRARDLRVASLACAGVGLTLAVIATIRWAGEDPPAADLTRPPSRPAVSIGGDASWFGISIGGAL